MKKVVDGLGHLRADAVDRPQVVGAGARDGLGGAEMLEQSPLTRRADANLTEAAGFRIWLRGCL